MRFVPALLLASALTASAQTNPSNTTQTASAMPVSAATRDAIRQLVGEVIVDGHAYDYDRQIADTVGPRLTGSDNYVHAVSWAEEQFRSLGLKNVHTESWTIPATWEPEVAATGAVVEPRRQTLHIYSFGWSPSTPKGGVKGEVFYLKSFSPETLAASKDKIKGSVVLVSEGAFGEHPTLKAFFDGINQLTKLEPSALLVAGGANGTETSTALSFDGSVAPFPEAQIGREDAGLIERMAEKGPVKVEFSFQNRIRRNVEINNVVAELPGTDAAAGVVLVGAHLDSWHPGTGAQDNGTGVATVLETARAMKALNRPARRTVRFVLFGGEEEGLLGSNAYVKKHMGDLSSIDAVLISDSGAEPAKGWLVMGRDDEQTALENVEPLLAGLGSNHTSTNTEFLFETDHAGFDMHGVPTLVLDTGVEKYFKLHHKASDTFDSVVQADLDQGVATTAATAYAIADSAEAFAPHVAADKVDEFLKKYNQFDDYTFLKGAGDLP